MSDKVNVQDTIKKFNAPEKSNTAPTFEKEKLPIRGKKDTYHKNQYDSCLYENNEENNLPVDTSLVSNSLTHRTQKLKDYPLECSSQEEYLPSSRFDETDDFNKGQCFNEGKNFIDCEYDNYNTSSKRVEDEYLTLTEDVTSVEDFVTVEAVPPVEDLKWVENVAPLENVLSAETVENKGLKISKQKENKSTPRKSARYYKVYSSDDESDSNQPIVKKSDKITEIIEDLVKSEEIYISNLRILVEEIIPHLYNYFRTDSRYIQILHNLFGNLESIFQEGERFLLSLKRSRASLQRVEFAFKSSSVLFNLYPYYIKNKSGLNDYPIRFDDVVKEKQLKLNIAPTSLGDYLRAPAERLDKYDLILNEILDDLKHSNGAWDGIHSVKTMIEESRRKISQLIMADSISGCQINLMNQGPLLMTARFKVLKPQKFDAIVFLFDNAIVFAQEGNINGLRYVDSIEMSDLWFCGLPAEPYIFELRKNTRPTRDTYVLQAFNEGMKADWTFRITDKLWDQLQIAKARHK